MFHETFDVFTDSKYDIRINWTTKKVKQSFNLKIEILIHHV